MKAKILSNSVKGNKDGTVSVKFDKGVDRVELIRLEDIELDINRFDRAIVQNPDDLVTAEIMNHLDAIQELRDNQPTFAERTQEILDNPSDIEKHLNGVTE